MKYIVKQSAFSLVTKFSILDENNIEKYYVEKKILSFGMHYNFYDNSQNELFEIKQDIGNFFPKFDLIKSGQLAGSIKRKLEFNVNEFEIEPIGWIIKGETFGLRHNYQVFNGDMPIASIKKVIQFGGDCYEVEVYDEKNIFIVLSSVVVIDAIMFNGSE